MTNDGKMAEIVSNEYNTRRTRDKEFKRLKFRINKSDGITEKVNVSKINYVCIFFSFTYFYQISYEKY